MVEPRKLFTQVDNALTAELKFVDFKAAFRFMTLVADLADAQGHHPEWSNVYNRVSIKLTTHDAGNCVTDKDWRLAKAIEQHPEVLSLDIEH